MRTKRLVVALATCLLMASVCGASEIADYLQRISVTVRAGGSEGSGVLVTRDMRLSDTENETQKVSFVLTAAHVVDGLRSVRTVIDAKGVERKVVEFKEAQVIRELVERGRKVGEAKMDAAVIKYSDADDGEDVAVLLVRKRDFEPQSARFLLSDDPVPIGTQLFHVGSLLGQSGANSMTAGIMSQIGRVLDLGGGNGVVFDQTTVSAFPGSSGGGVFLAKEGDDQGRYIGMLVRGAGESFNLIVPVRRLKKYCEDVSLMWLLDDTVAPPTLAALGQIPIEESALTHKLSNSTDAKLFPVLIKEL